MTEEELDLLGYVLRAFNSECNKNYSFDSAQKFYELIKILTRPKPEKFLCLACRKKYKLCEVEE